MKILETKHLKKYYGSGNGQVKAVNDISISVEKGEFVAIVGTSGSGKTTLLNLLGGWIMRTVERSSLTDSRC
ncbi:putative uncharacterized protein [Blautia hydrogenotrophica CAG:147]|nr:putative uncharacterized protein [Blautia hydrogenotrophica CAG:147]